MRLRAENPPNASTIFRQTPQKFCAKRLKKRAYITENQRRSMCFVMHFLMLLFLFYFNPALWRQHKMV